MERRIVECVANFSEGRSQAVVAALAESIAKVPGVALLDSTMDADHHRSVLTFAGTPAGVVTAAVHAVGQAVALIDLNRHAGVHPRIGAADVVPFVPVQGVSIEYCIQLAEEAGAQIWQRWRVPVYLYEAAARVSERRLLENVRRGGFEGLRERIRTDPERQPDFGDRELHPTAGAVAVGARKFLIAWNVNLATGDVGIAKSIARAIRASSGGFPNVKALGLELASRGLSQISMNLTDFETTPLHTVYDAIHQLAESAGAGIAGSEIIGLVPRQAMEGAAAHYLRCENFRPDIILEQRLTDVMEKSPAAEFLESIADPGISYGGGSASAMGGAMAAALGTLVCRLLATVEQTFEAHRAFFMEAVRRDADAFAALMGSGKPGQAEIQTATVVPLEIAERAAALERDLRAMDVPAKFQSDIVSALALARAAGTGASATARLNFQELAPGSLRDTLASRLAGLSPVAD
ncbi:MAG TPA: glutamate formimidoyltransferase [Bryobacteraceae bacterium]|nr:glutamate formimidoyltransferase [Bryobacteraceae bacterium]